MYGGLRRELVSLLRCPRDAGELRVGEATELRGQLLWNSRLDCMECAASYTVHNGIVMMENAAPPDAESEYERTQRDVLAPNTDFAWESSWESQSEMVPTLHACGKLAGAFVLELGAGCGRYSHILAKSAACLVATDFSVRSLGRLAARLRSEDNVALVCADVTTVKFSPATFDVVISTLTSNLPSDQHRHEMYRVATRVLRKNGRFVHSAHHYGWWERLRNEKKSGHYADTVGIYRRLFNARELTQEMRGYFAEVACNYMVIYLPYMRRLGVPLLSTSLACAKVPVLRGFGGLLLIQARQPTH